MSEQARRNREAFPQAAGFVDAMRAVFGPGVVLEYAEEGGRTIGKLGPDGVPVIEKNTNEGLDMKQTNKGRGHG